MKPLLVNTTHPRMHTHRHTQTYNTNTNTHTHFGEKLRLLCQWLGGEEPCTRGVIEMAGEKGSEA